MINLIRKWLGLCQHTWIDQGVVTITSKGVPIEFRMRQRCTKCGRFRNLTM